MASASIAGMKRFAGQTFIVTGGARGIGFGIALRLFAEGLLAVCLVTRTLMCGVACALQVLFTARSSISTKLSSRTLWRYGSSRAYPA